jgi:NAD(P)-dependent dehydrogenase (short-subunit alcohol dehydrogenase family)
MDTLRKLAVVTGAGLGSAASLVRMLAEERCSVAACGRNATAVPDTMRSPRRAPESVRDLRARLRNVVASWLRYVGRRDSSPSLILSEHPAPDICRGLVALCAGSGSRDWREVAPRAFVVLRAGGS